MIEICFNDFAHGVLIASSLVKYLPASIYEEDIQAVKRMYDSEL